VVFTIGIVIHCMTELPCVKNKVFVDSNLLIYGHDKDAGAKHVIANKILRDLWNSETGVLSMQVLQEFYTVVTRKIQTPLPKSVARVFVEEYATWWIETTPIEISSAFRIEDIAKISFWDALIVAAAVKSGASEILSEDMNAGQVIAGVRIVNPFASAS